MEGSPTKDGETVAGTTPDGDAAKEEVQVDAETTPGEIVATSSNITDMPEQTTTNVPSKTTNAPEHHGGEHGARSRTRTMRKVTHTSREPPHARITPSVFDTWRTKTRQFTTAPKKSQTN